MSKSIVIELIIHSFKNIFNFKGRAGRLEYFLFGIINTTLQTIITLGINTIIIIAPEIIVKVMILLIIAFMVTSFLMNLAIFSRRMHDLNSSAWSVLFWFIPIIGQIYGIYMLILLTFKKGKREPNIYGDPIKEFSMTAIDYLYLLLAIILPIILYIFSIDAFKMIITSN